ncbi:MAG: DUF2914 domain-containing protein [Desulfuromonadales bacterium]|nr:DUF2914 domain-containing protein [Desulfuromonadales bacterium]
MGWLKSLFLRLVEIFKRYSGLMAVLGFASGVASFLLVEGREAYAQLFAMLMLASWVWLVLENWLRAGLLRRFGFDMPPVLMRFGTQMVQQESLFFALPFFLVTTNWDHGQAIFTGLLLLCALISVIDPIYYGQLAPRRSLFIVFHALSLFAVLLVVLPLILHLTTGQSLALALLMALLFSLPSLGQLLPHDRWWRLPLLALMLTALAAGLWQARSWVPPATLRLIGITLSQQIDHQQRTAGASLDQLDAATLKRDGLYAWTAVRAPRGLREQIHHVWLHNGVEVDRITLDIRGGRDEGYRAWTHKLNFPADSLGRWQVRVVTDSGQLIGLTRFTVSQGAESAPEPVPLSQ